MSQPNKKKGNNPRDGIVVFLIAAAFGLVIYLSSGRNIISQTHSERQVLRLLQDGGASTTATTVSRDRGYGYFDDRALREVWPSDLYLSFVVEDRTIEVKVGDWGATSGDKINIRYLTSDPTVIYYANAPDVLVSMQNAIWYRTLKLAFFWAIILCPPFFGLFIFLICVVPDTHLGLWIALLAVVGGFLATYLNAIG